MSRASRLLERSRSSLLVSGAMAGLALRLVTVLATPVSIGLVARGLVDDGRFSTYATVLAAGTTIGLLCTFQLRELIARADDDELAGTWALGGLTATLVAGLTVVAGLGAGLLGSSPSLVVALGLLILAQPIESMSAGQLIRRQEAGRLGLIQSSIPILRLVGAGALFLTPQPTVAQFIAAHALAQVLPSLVGIGAAGVRPLVASWTNRSRLGPSARAGIALTMTLSGSIVVQRSDVALLGLLPSETPAGDYLAVLQVLDVPWLLSAAALTLLVPALRQRDGAGQRRLVDRLLAGLVVVMAVAAVAAALAAIPIGWLLLDRRPDIDSATIAVAAGATVLSTAFGLLGQYAVVLRLDVNIARYSMAGAVGNVVANVALIPVLGGLGAAAATFATYAFLVAALSSIVFPGVARRRAGPTVAVALTSAAVAFAGLLAAPESWQRIGSLS